MSKEWEAENIFDVFGSDYARQILVMTSVEAMSAQDLADRCEASLPTVYRRLDALKEYDLLREDTEIDMDGNHYKTYESNLDSICFEVEDGGFDIDIQLRKSLVDQFEAFWGDLERSETEALSDTGE